MDRLRHPSYLYDNSNIQLQDFLHLPLLWIGPLHYFEARSTTKKLTVFKLKLFSGIFCCCMLNPEFFILPWQLLSICDMNNKCLTWTNKKWMYLVANGWTFCVFIEVSWSKHEYINNKTKIKIIFENCEHLLKTSTY